MFALVFALGGATAWYGYTKIQSLSQKVAEFEGQVAETTVTLEADIAKTNSVLSAAIEDQSKSIEARVGTIAGSVTTLEKLTKTDPQLLAKYSKIYFLNENYMPDDLVEIEGEYKYYEDRPMLTIRQVNAKLEDMLEEAEDDGIELFVASAYRSFAEQKNIKSSYTVTYGAGTANQFSAEQGFSEHQLGTTVDLIAKGLGGALTTAFDATEAFAWLQKNAHKYGFVLSYPKGNSYYMYEPWHWRYVGVKLATDLYEDGKYFYDLDQRKINTYLVYLFD
jgi:LAS superfamily LD-carboxypeptidase LdcB